MNSETIRHMTRAELIDWLETNGIAVEVTGIALDDCTDDNLRDEVCTLLQSAPR